MGGEEDDRAQLQLADALKFEVYKDLRTRKDIISISDADPKQEREKAAPEDIEEAVMADSDMNSSYASLP